ncbi:hypothetical protein ACQP2U_42595 (plasmid) [Nocardia sp. CA-084685]|uniref:hypothetical protein n=1 Tax=Nocardia sp. CA-084685 TaxID=3239970 RepID=UPI003D96BAD6
MTTRDAAETVLRAWNRYEIDRGAPPIIDYDCYPSSEEIPALPNRLDALRQLTALKESATAAGDIALATRLDAHIAYCSALLGERESLEWYVSRTQGSVPTGWSEEYLTARRDLAIDMMDRVGVGWGPDTADDLAAAEGILSPDELAGAIRDAAAEYEPAVREATGTTAPYELDILTVDEDAYWSYWLDGVGRRARLRMNRRRARYTKVATRQFALHEILGHALQFASIADRCATEDVPWIRLFSVHTPSQTLFEGLAQALPLFVAADDEQLIARVRLDHYQQLVRAKLHIALAAEVPILEIADQARRWVPFWTDTQISDLMTDRSADVLLRSYLWSYPAGCDWFVRLADTKGAPARRILHAVYRAPHTPAELMALWPEGPAIGGE